MRNLIIGTLTVAALLLTLTAHAYPPAPTTGADPQDQALAYFSDRPIWDVGRLGDWMYVGGEFRFFGMPTFGMIGYDLADRLPQPVTLISPSNGEIALIDDGSGGYFIGNKGFTVITKPGYSRLLQIASDGQIDTTWDALVLGDVVSLARDATTLYVGGWYRQPNGNISGGYLQAIRLADRQIRYQRTDLPSAPESLALHGTAIYLGGNGGPPWLLAFERATGQPLPWAPQFPTVYSLLEQIVATDDRLYVGGGFTQVNGQIRHGLAAFALPSGELLDWAPSVTPGGFFNQLQIIGDTLFVGGSFTELAGAPRSRVAAFTASTGALTPFTLPAELQTDPKVASSFAAFADRLIMIRETAFRDPSETWARVHQIIEVERTDGQTSLGPVIYGTNSQIQLSRSNSAVFVTSLDGGIVSTSPVLNQGLARIDPTTGELSDWRPPADIGVVRAITMSTDRLLISDGYQLRALDPERNVWEPWAAQVRPPGSPLPRVYPMHVIGDTLIYPGLDPAAPEAGYGLMAVDLTSGAVRRWSQSFPLFEPYWSVTSMVAANGRLYVGGDFAATPPGGPAGGLEGLIALDLTTGALLNWMPPFPESPYGAYTGGMALSDGLLYVAGTFPESAGALLRGLLAIDLASGRLHSWSAQGCEACNLLAVTDGYVLSRVTAPRENAALSAIRAFDRTTGAMLDWSVTINDGGGSYHNADSLGIHLDRGRLYIFGFVFGVGMVDSASLLIVPAPGVAPVPTVTPSPTTGPTQGPYRIRLPVMTGRGG